MSFWCLQFPPKNERKQVDLRFHSSKVEFVRSFFGGNVGLKKLFRICLTFQDTDKMCADSSTGNTPNTPQFIQPICPNRPIIWNIFEKSCHHISIVHCPKMRSDGALVATLSLENPILGFQQHVLGYGNTGCGVFKRGIQNQKDFCIKINIPKGNY